jgi:hypothetical protein
MGLKARYLLALKASELIGWEASLRNKESMGSLLDSTQAHKKVRYV